MSLFGSSRREKSATGNKPAGAPPRPHGDLPDFRDSHALAREIAVAKSIAEAVSIDAASLAGARLLVSRTEMRRAGWLEGLPETKATPISSMAYKLALVASGRFDAAVTLWPKNEWDVAAADLLVREAGGRVTDADGAGFAYNRADPGLRAVVAAGPRLHEALLDRLAGINDPAVPLA